VCSLPRVGIPRVYNGVYASLGVYLPIYTTLPTMVGIHHPGIPHPVPPWVYRTHCWSAAPLSACPDCCTVELRRSPGLRKGETPGWESLRPSQDPNSVKVGREFCAEFPALSRKV